MILIVGILLVYGVGALPPMSFYTTAFIACGLTLIVALFMIWVPETPLFLVAKGDNEQANKVLKWLRGPQIDVRNELKEINDTVSQQHKLSLVEFLKTLTQRNVYLPFVLMLFVMMFQQFSGINALIFYAASIFKTAGFGENSEYVALFSVGFTATFFTFVAVFLIDLFGRKILLFVSALTMALSSTGIGVSMFYQDCDVCSNMNALAVVSVIVFEMGFSIGYGAIPWVLIAEMIPLHVRGYLGGVLSLVNWCCATIVVGCYLSYAREIGEDVAWWTFAGINVLSALFIVIFLPETKGKKLEGVEQQMVEKFRFCV